MKEQKAQPFIQILERNLTMTLSRLMIVSCLLLVGALSYAQAAIDLPKSDEMITVRFFEGEPSDGDEVTSQFTVRVGDSSIGHKISGVEDADHILLEAAGLRLAFEAESITNTLSTSFKNVNDSNAVTLAEVVRGIYDCAAGEMNLAIFTDEGIVTGFYAYHPWVDPLVNVEDADHLILISNAAISETFATPTNAIRASLNHVNVTIDGAVEALGTLN